MITASLVLFQNSKEQIENLINCLNKSDIKVKTYFVDNSDSPEFFQWLKDKIKDSESFEYLYIGQNLGFGKGHNKIIQNLSASENDFHIILNPDISFEPSTISKMQQFMIENPGVGLLSPKVIYPDGQLQYLCRLMPTPYNLFIRRTGIKKLIAENDRIYELRDFSYNETAEIPILSGCFMFFRNSVLKKTNGFDPNFFMYLEDFDLARRALDFGQNIFFPKAQITHDYGKGSYRSVRLLLAHIVSAVKYFNKWGWFFDSKRSEINQRVLAKLNLSK